MAVIELDLTAQPGPPLSSLPPAHRYRLPGLMLAALLAITLGGAAPVRPTLWDLVGSVPTQPPGGIEFDYHLAAGRVYTATPDRAFRVVTAWQLQRPLHRLWTARLPAKEVGPGGIGVGGVSVEQAGDVVLVADGPVMTVLDARTGRVRWTADGALTPLDGGRVGLLLNAFDTPEHRLEAHGVDLRTGQLTWSAKLPGMMTFPAPGPALLVVGPDRLQRRDGATGAVVREVRIPKGDGAIGANLVGDLFVLYYGDETSIGRQVAYDAVTLVRRWEHRSPRVMTAPVPCSGLLCAGSRVALDVLDPATGQPAWQAPADVDLMAAGDYVLEIAAAAGPPLRLVDPATGVLRVTPDGWGELVGNTPLVLRRSAPGGRSVFGVVLPGRDRVQLLGETTGPVSACRAVPGYLACRGTGDLKIWAYRV
jgi:putative pyrroloquinoline-quinone binding quinoprotein